MNRLVGLWRDFHNPSDYLNMSSHTVGVPGNPWSDSGVAFLAHASVLAVSHVPNLG